MSKLPDNFLELHQILSMKRRLPRALTYHFNNFLELQDKAYFDIDDRNTKYGPETLAAMEVIMFEVQAYVNQARRFRFFLNNQLAKRLITPPSNAKLLSAWGYFVNADGIITLLGNKWASHRSYDYPKIGDSENTHAEVLLNLDGSVTFWENRQMVVHFHHTKLNLNVQHYEIINLVKWVFEQPKIKKILREYE